MTYIEWPSFPSLEAPEDLLRETLLEAYRDGIETEKFYPPYYQYVYVCP